MLPKTTSKIARIVLIAAIIFAALRLIVQVALVFVPISDQVGADLTVSYLEAAQQFRQQQDMYHEPMDYVEGHYLYSPAFALIMVPFTFLPVQVTILFFLFLNVGVYYLFFRSWERLFRKFHLDKARAILIWSLPIWLLYTPFWSNLVYLNMYTILALAGTLFIESVMEEKIWPAALLLTLILITKPHWAFAAAVPLLLGRYRFFAKLLLGGFLGYLACFLAVALFSSPGYAADQYLGQVELLARLSREYPWRGPDAGFLGYCHSIKQIVIYLGYPTALATIIKSVLLVPAGIVFVKFLVRPVRMAGHQVPELALALSFLLYLAVFLWLDMLWEAWLSIAIYIYLMSVCGKVWRNILSFLFIPYVLLDAYRLILFIVGAPFINEAYLAWDFSLYFPIILVVVLVLYLAVFQRLIGPTRRLLPNR